MVLSFIDVSIQYCFDVLKNYCASAPLHADVPVQLLLMATKAEN